MPFHWYDSDRKTPISFPLDLGNFTDGEASNKLLWFYCDFSIEDLTIKLDGHPSFLIAKGWSNRPQAFVDYLGRLYWKVVSANTWIPIYVKFKSGMVEASDEPYEVSLKFTGELLG